ncbi:MAG: Endodeoxyribonuclease RusA [Candidatus Bathyarchaeota archaeon BA1]|nr:MAG: Endodeoxyribonuclease RusA [Candidatus Bathyarchaeota archaeon BA1]
MPPAKLTVADFMQKLCQRARYGIQGEKPIAIIVALKYIYENPQLVGKHLLELFDDPKHESQVREIFIDLAKRHGRIGEPVTSWSVITGKNRELQNAIMKSANVNEAFSELTLEEINQLLELYIQTLEKTTKPAPDVKVEKISRTPLRLPFKEAVGTVVSVFVPGSPQTFGDKRYEEPWKIRIAQKVKESCSSELPIKDKVQVHLIFYLFRERRVDLDNLIKPCLDAIGSVLFEKRKGARSNWDTDDYWIFKIIAEKNIISKENQEGAKIVISQLVGM